ncbi:MAG: signal peptidase II [Clostridiales bacterium]|jgi:signal peptidase II|nr:signal peptidase II [Clostridiales bacterium]
MIKTIAYIKKAKLELILIVLFVLIDLLSKWFVVHNWTGTPSTIIDNLLYIHYVRNYNAAFGSDFGLSNIFGDDGAKSFFVIFSIVFMLGFCVFLYIWRDRKHLARVAIALIIAGGIGNLYDRMVFGYVRDFVRIVFGGADLPLLGTEFAIFNIADSCLTIGIVLLIWYILFVYHKDIAKIEPNNKQPDQSNSMNTRGAG